MTAGTNPVATFALPVNTTQDSTTYKANIDGDFAVAQRVVDQFAPRQTGTPAMTITLDPGSVFNGVTLTEQAAQTSSTITAPAAAHFRIDRAVISAATGALSIITGTPTTGTPAAPAITAGYLPVAQISLSSTTTTITNSIITDERNFWGTPSSGVTAGSYTLASITVDAEGRLTAASSGSNPVATSSTAGTVIPDGTIITVNGSGDITVASVSSSAFGVVKVDNTTITASAGVISATLGASSIGTNGYQKFAASGLVLQWGTASLTNGSSLTTVSFPIAFPNACFTVTANVNNDPTTNASMCSIGSVGTSSFGALLYQGAGNFTNGLIGWIAVGH